jgi:hypothetical protein
VELLCEFVSSYKIEFGQFWFYKTKEARCVNSIKTTFYTIFFMFCCLQPIFILKNLLELSFVNNHSLVESNFVSTMFKHGKDVDLLILLKLYIVHLKGLAFWTPPMSYLVAYFLAFQVYKCIDLMCIFIFRV